tara:strand:+ start:362 stop:1582 length:1221 start_codon:yes stop_codon:yes gene_type:complete
MTQKKAKDMTLRDALTPVFDAEAPLHGAIAGMPMKDYRAAVGIAPSDLKKGSEDHKPSRGERGHLLKLAVSKLQQEFDTQGEKIPAWMDERPASKVFDFGTAYHEMLLTPHSFQDSIAVVDDAMIAGFVAQAKERKAPAEAKAFSWRIAPAREWKKANPDQEPTDFEKAEIMRVYQESKTADVKFHPRLTEYTEFVAKQESEGKIVIEQKTKDRLDKMIGALYDLPENSEVGEYLKSLPDEKDRMEVSLFANMKIGGQSNEDLPTIQLKGRVDYIPGDNTILDPKTCQSCNFNDFGRDVESFGYDFSMAGYTVLSELLAETETAQRYGFPIKKVGFLAQEKTAPFLAKMYFLPEEWLDWAKRVYKNEVMRLCRSYQTNDWNGIDSKDGVQTLLPSPWRAKEIEAFM